MLGSIHWVLFGPSVLFGSSVLQMWSRRAASIAHPQAISPRVREASATSQAPVCARMVPHAGMLCMAHLTALHVRVAPAGQAASRHAGDHIVVACAALQAFLDKAVDPLVDMTTAHANRHSNVGDRHPM